MTQSAVAAFVVLLAGALVVSIAAERVRIPAAVLLVVAGVCAGSIAHLHLPFAFGPTLLFVFLPPLIFEAAWTIDLNALRRAANRVALLAFPGTLLTAFAIAGALVMLHQLSFVSALLFGAIVSATDPVAVIATFRSVAVPVGVRTLVEAESLANDGVAVVLYGIALTLVAGGQLSAVGALAHGVVAVVGGTLIGIGTAALVGLVLRATGDAEHEIAATFAQAYLAYLAADRLGWSGIFATAASAIALRAMLRRRASLVENAAAVDRCWSAAAFVANAAVFIATGLVVPLTRLLDAPVLIATAVLVVLAARLLLAAAIAREPRTAVTVFLAGIRGALPLALALSLPETTPDRGVLVDAVFAVVLATFVLQGLPLGLVVRRLYGTPVSEPSRQAAPQGDAALAVQRRRPRG
ncbi:MAG TPA: cation:proton antiporter [Candidatus Sulfotelmatobacter sp.]|nr:cation:proton antiporter [Candidatus Sulfotelmatobacter sp.]